MAEMVEAVTERYPVREEELGKIKVSRRWVAVQLVGVTILIVLAEATMLFLDQYIKPDPRAYQFGVGHLFIIRLFSLVVACIPTLLVYTLHPFFQWLILTLWGIYVFGPVFLGPAYYVLFPLPFLWLPLFVARANAVSYVVTDKAVMIIDNWITKEKKTRIYSKLSGAKLEQGILGRLLGYGTIVLQVTDLETYALKRALGIDRFKTWPDFDNSLFCVPNPEKVYKAVAHLVKYRDISETLERVGERIVERLESIERRLPPSPPPDTMYA